MPLQTDNTGPRNWVEIHADYLYAFARARIADEEQARDLVQDTFLAALQKIHSFEGKSTERTWLTAILKNKIIDVYRKKSSLAAFTTVTDAEAEQQDFFADDGHWKRPNQPQNIGSVEQHPFESKEFNHVLKACLEKLPVLWRAVFTMKHIDEEESDLICAELKVTPSNFWVIIHRAKINLRACMQKNWI